MTSSSAARVAVTAGDWEHATAGSAVASSHGDPDTAAPPPSRGRVARGSSQYAAVIDGHVDDDDEDEDDLNDDVNGREEVGGATDDGTLVDQRRFAKSLAPETRKTMKRLSVEDRALLDKTSALLTNPMAHVLIATQRELKRLRRMQERIRSKAKAPPLVPPPPDGETAASHGADGGPHQNHGPREGDDPAHPRFSLSQFVRATRRQIQPTMAHILETKATTAPPSPSTGACEAPPAPWRRRLRALIKTQTFRALVYVVVFGDMLVLALDPGHENPTYGRLDVGLTLLLLLELVLKGLAVGFIRGPEAFFRRSKFRILNVVLLVASLLSHLGGRRWHILRGIKTFRCLTLYAGLRRILRSLMRAVPFLANVGTLALFFLLAFSIFGLEAFKGAYDRQCAVTHIGADNATLPALPRMYCAANAACGSRTCEPVPRSSAFVNFDTGVRSLFLVFLVVAQDGWVADIMEPVVEYTSALSSLFFVAIVGSMVFLVVNLFVAVITTAFMNFTVENEIATEGSDGDGQRRATAPACGMKKMDPEAEETRVSLIMGATLAIEESIQASSSSNNNNAKTDPTTGAATHSDPMAAGTTASTATSAAGIVAPLSTGTLLARTNRYHSLRNLTVETTLELIQNAASVKEFLAAAAATGLPDPALATTTTTTTMTASTATTASSGHAAPSSRKPTALHTQAPFPSLSNLVGPGAGAHPLFVRFQGFVLSKRFDDCITACIIANTGFLLVEYPNMDATMRLVLNVSEYFFGAVFLLEMVARIVAMRGLRTYLRSTERFFDMVVVVCTTINMVLNNLNTSFSGLNSVSSLRTLRVSRLMMKWEGTRKLIESVLKSSRAVMDVVMFLILFQVVNSIVAMELFGGSHLSNDGESPRWNFDTFGRSFLTLLQVITADQWSSVTYDAVNADDPHVLLVPFLIINFIIGQYVLLNLFIAVILENFSITEEEAYQLQLEQIIAIPKELDIYEKIEEEGVRAFGEMEALDNVSNVKLRMFLGLDDARTSSLAAPLPPQGSSSDHASHGRRGGGKHRGRRPLAAEASGLARIGASWRRFCRRVTANAWFGRLVMVMIFVSCLTLVLDEPHPWVHADGGGDATLTLALSVTNKVVLAVLVFEFVAKVSSTGFGFDYLRMSVFHSDERLGYVWKQAYMEDKWNQLDLFLLIVTIADEIISYRSGGGVGLARVFRAGRVLRPLRIVGRNHEMKLILNAVAQSLPHVGNVFALCSIVYIIFGVVGRSLFSGLFYSCNDKGVATMAECVGFFIIEPDGALPLQEAAAKVTVPVGGGILAPRVWDNARFSFDNIGAAFLTLLEMTSLKWVDKTFAAMDITGANRQPEREHTPLYALFFVLYVYIGALFVIRLFVGVLVEQFQRNNGTQILTESQKSWVDLEKFVLLLKPLQSIPRPAHPALNRIYELCKHPYFGRGIAVAILLNVLLLLFNPSSSSSSSSDSTSSQVVELLFLSIFTLEAVLKCVAFRHHYILSMSGVFELSILIGSLVAYSLAKGYHQIVQAGRIFRVMRVLRFVRLNRGVYTVFQTFRASLKPIAHIFFLLFMIFFIFAIVGRQLFGGIRYGPSLNHFSNFRTFGSSFVLLFQIMSGDDWHLTMTDCMQGRPFCVERPNPRTGDLESDCGSGGGAVLFFVTYVLLVVFVFLNLFIAVILENFRSCYLQGDVCPISLADFESYREVFRKYDPKNSGVLPLWQLASFLADLPPGLRVDRDTQRTAFLQVRSQVQALLESCQQQRCKRPFFNELLRMLCIHQLGIRALPYEQQRDRVKQIFIYRAKVADMLVEAVVTGFVQRWRRRRERQQLANLRAKMRPEVALTRQVSDRGRRVSRSMTVSTEPMGAANGAATTATTTTMTTVVAADDNAQTPPEAVAVVAVVAGPLVAGGESDERRIENLVSETVVPGSASASAASQAEAAAATRTIPAVAEAVSDGDDGGGGTEEPPTEADGEQLADASEENNENAHDVDDSPTDRDPHAHDPHPHHQHHQHHHHHHHHHRRRPHGHHRHPKHHKKKKARDSEDAEGADDGLVAVDAEAAAASTTIRAAPPTGEDGGGGGGGASPREEVVVVDAALLEEGLVQRSTERHPPRRLPTLAAGPSAKVVPT